jgi:hypothetical protein
MTDNPGSSRPLPADRVCPAREGEGHVPSAADRSARSTRRLLARLPIPRAAVTVRMLRTVLRPPPR